MQLYSFYYRILNNFRISNTSSYYFFNNAIITHNKDKLISYNISNGNIFWSIDVKKIVNKKNKIIKIECINDILYIFINNGKVITIKDNNIYDILDLTILSHSHLIYLYE